MPVFSKKRRGSFCPLLPEPPVQISTTLTKPPRRKMSEPVNIYDMDESQAKLSTKPRTKSTIEESKPRINSAIEESRLRTNSTIERSAYDMGSTMSLISNKSSSSAVGRLFKRKERNSIEIKYERQKMRRNSSVEANMLIKTADISLETQIYGEYLIHTIKSYTMSLAKFEPLVYDEKW